MNFLISNLSGIIEFTNFMQQSTSFGFISNNFTNTLNIDYFREVHKLYNTRKTSRFGNCSL